MANIFSRLSGNSKGGGAERATAFINALKAQLGINDTQASSIETALHAFMQERKQNKQEGDKEAMKTARQSLMQNIHSVLTPEQQKMFDSKKEEFKNLLKK
ncbi:MAG TPA: hypothetical protein VFM99_07285 [Chitinophagales bacterium]|nr:hypothetical protein [Chitinophagales bacterium]